MVLIEFEEGEANIVWDGNHQKYTFRNNKSTNESPCHTRTRYLDELIFSFAVSGGDLTIEIK